MSAVYYAGIDIGSNSVLLAIAKYEQQQLVIVEERSTITALGKDLDKNLNFLPESMNDTYDALKNYQQLISKYPTAKLKVTATEASRVAKNAPEFFKKISNELGIHILVISAAEEARLAALGATFKLPPNFPKNFMLIDIGGASTEFTQVQSDPFTIQKSVSLPIGTVRTQNYLLDNLDYYQKQWLACCDLFHHNFLNFDQGLPVLAIAGTFTAIAMVQLQSKSFDENTLLGTVLGITDVENLQNSLGRFSSEELLQAYPHLGKRAQTFKAGLTLVLDIFQLLKKTEMHISPYGLRHGIIRDLVAQ